MILYKLTDENHETRGPTKWGVGVTHTAQGEGDALCSDGVLHAYVSPELAVLLNPIHASFRQPVLWEAEGEVCVREGGLKVGCKSLTTLRILPLPEASTLQRVAFGVLCAKAISVDAIFCRWAEGWLNGSDRSRRAAMEAWAAAWAAATAAAARAARSEEHTSELQSPS